MRKVNISTIQSVERAISLLTLFSHEKPVWNLNEIVSETKLSRATAYRLLYTLERGGLINYNAESAQYSLGTRLIGLGMIALSNFSLRKVLSPKLDALIEELGHTLFVGIIENDHLLYIDKRERAEGLKVGSEVGIMRPPHYGILGKLLLAYKDEDYVMQLLERYPLEKHTPKSIVDHERLISLLRKVRKERYIIAEEETVTGVSGVAVPIFQHDGEVIAGISILAPTFQFNHEKEKIMDKMQKIGREVSQALGYGTT